MSEKKLTDLEYFHFLGWFMSSDPWPIDNDGDESIRSMTGLANHEAKSRGYDSWVEALHYHMKKK